MPLSDRQQQAVHVLDWLLDPEERRTGRSFALAVALIRCALRYPGQEVHYGDLPFDVPRSSWRQTVIGYIQRLVASDPAISPHVTYSTAGFRFSLPAPITDWQPPQRGFPADEPPSGSIEGQMELVRGLVEERMREGLNRSVWEDANPPAASVVQEQLETLASDLRQATINATMQVVEQHGLQISEEAVTRVVEQAARPPGDDDLASIEHVATVLAQRLQTPEGQEAMQRAADETRERTRQLRQAEMQARMQRLNRNHDPRLRRGPARPHIMLPPPTTHRMGEVGTMSTREATMAEVTRVQPQPPPRLNRYEMLSED